MLFLIFCFPENGPLECCFPENRTLKCCFPVKKNKMDNSQNGYSSVEKTVKIKKISFSTISFLYHGDLMRDLPLQLRLGNKIDTLF